MCSFRTELKYSSRLNHTLKNSDLDKLDSSYLEFAIFGLWKINIISLIKTKASLAKQFHIQPSEIDNMAMWEYEYFVEALNDQIKEENKQQEEDMKKYDWDKYKNLSDPTKYKTPSIPKMPKF